MTPLESQFDKLRSQDSYPQATMEPLATGGYLISLPNYELPEGWNVQSATIRFVVPPGYPASMPDCFWVHPAPIRLKNGATPQNSNDGNAIPGYPGDPRSHGTWFSWHIQQWNPNSDSLMTFVGVIKQRLKPAR